LTANGHSTIDNIWITKKCRMNAETRLNRYSTLAHLLTTYYSLLLIVFTVANNSPDQYFPKISLCLSIAILCLSLVMHGFKFGERALMHRQCYLSLNEILSSSSTDVEKISKYTSIIDGYPNHSHIDYVSLIVINNFSSIKKLKNSEGEIHCSKSLISLFAFRWIGLIFFIILSVSLPLLYFLNNLPHNNAST